MSAGFTPGPWEAHTFMVVANGGRDRITHVGGNLPPPRVEESVANARLIAAAPQLYERVQSSIVALEEAAKLLEGHGLAGCANIMRGYIVGNDTALAAARGDA